METSDLNNDVETVVDCPVLTKSDRATQQMLEYWVEGVLLLCFAVFGIIGNLFSTLILGRKSMRNSFNILLIALALVDFTYLVCSILKSLRLRFEITSDLHVLLVPYFLHPIQNIAITASIFLTVAIALERFVAVHHPIHYRQASNNSTLLRRRVASYLIPVFFISVLFNITKFFEVYAVFPEDEMRKYLDTLTDQFSNNSLVYETNFTTMFSALPKLPPARVDITDFRKHPMYSIYFNWFRFITNGIIPLILLIYFNAKIYMKIRQRSVNKDKTQRAQQAVPKQLEYGRDPVTRSRRRKVAILSRGVQLEETQQIEEEMELQPVKDNRLEEVHSNGGADGQTSIQANGKTFIPCA